jgi:polyhydroxybutyrate depolymerase
VPVFAINGTTDTLVPYAGGFFMPGVTSAPFASVEASFTGWAQRDACRGARHVSFEADSVVCESYDQCSGGVEVTQCTVSGGGHCWFGEALCVFGTNTSELRATDATWEFFKEYSLP